MFLRLYDRLFLQHPLLALVLCLAVVGGFCSQIPKFRLDASADSLVLENDHALRYYRQITSKYQSSDYLVLTYTPNRGSLFSSQVLDDIKALRDKLTTVEGVESVATILDVPLLFSPKVSLSDLENGINALENPGVDMDAARREFQENPVYSKQLLSPDGRTTALLVNLPVDHKVRDLLRRRTELRQKQYDKALNSEEAHELSEVEQVYRHRATLLTTAQNQTVDKIRLIMDEHRHQAGLFLGGVPMIIADMISFIKNDLIVFSLGVLFFLIITLAVIFRKLRWIMLPMVCCSVAGLTMIGLLGLMDWRVTVISSNFISLMLIITMSLTIHLIVRYRELCASQPDLDQQTLLRETVRLKFKPCLYTTLTTIVAFISLLVSSIRPVMDFGMMMTMGLIASFLLTFAIFPPLAMLLSPEKVTLSERQSPPLTMIFARFTENRGTLVLLLSLVLATLSGVGISRLVVENRFIDYFKSSTEIYQGMKLIDEKLGGTTPLDVIIDFKDNTAQDLETDNSFAGEDDLLLEDDLLSDDLLDDDLLNDDLLDDDLLDDGLLTDSQGHAQPAGPESDPDGAWFTSYRLEQVEKIHDYLDSLPETGKVLSLASMLKIVTSLNDGISLDDYELAILHRKLTAPIKDLLVSPYVSVQDNQVRLTTRVMESDTGLVRAELLKRIETFLQQKMGLAPEQIHFTNMLVLYNNMLQSLYRSQIMTIGVVFLAIMVMFLILFRSLPLALIAIVPNLLPAALVLGAMGLFGIPLDMMTITIAAISIGIAVDDTIHYIHRFKDEFAKDGNYQGAMNRSHASIGKAMYYTSLTIVIGFSILVMSNFVPTVYFGIFTGFAMLAALLAALTLLPKLLLLFKPFGPENH